MTTKRQGMFHGAVVADILHSRNLTKSEVANAIGITRGLFSQYLQGTRNPKRSTVQRIANALRVKISEISDYTEEDFFNALPPPQATGVPNQDNELALLRLLMAKLRRESENTSQSEIASRIGVSYSYISRLLSGDAEIENFPIKAFVRLCPELINWEAIKDSVDVSQDSLELAKVINDIKILVDQITDLNTAKTIRAMIKGVLDQ